jgi:hypothetical protein
MAVSLATTFYCAARFALSTRLSPRKGFNARSIRRSERTSQRKDFTKIKAFRVGKRAEALLDAGVRLTAAKQSPPIYDLSR